MVQILDKKFSLAKENVFLVSGVEKVNRTIRGLGLHDLTFESADNPGIELVRRNLEVRSSLVGEALEKPTQDEVPAELIALHNQGLALIKKNDPKSDNAACRIFREVAERGYSRSQYSLGYCYESGRGVDQDFAVANKWYQNAYHWLLILKGQKSKLAAEDWKELEAFLKTVETEVPVEGMNLILTLF